MFSKLSVRTKLTILHMALISVIALFIVFYFPKKLEKHEIIAMVDKTETIAKMISFSVSPSVVFHDRSDAEEVLQQTAKQNKDIVYLAILDDSSHIFAGVNTDQMSRTNISVSDQQIDSLITNTKIYEILTPIYHDNKIIGQVCIGSSLVRIKNEITRSRITSTLVSVTVFLIGLIAVFGISTLITRPLGYLARTVQQIAAGDLSQRAVISTSDEVGLFALSFNRMVDNLEIAKKDLENINRTLEQRVNERTKSLQEEIAERKIMAEELDRNVQRLALVLRSVPMAFYTTDITPGLPTTWISDQILQITGYAPNQFISDPTFWSSRVHPDDRESVLEGYNAVLVRGTNTTEYRWRCADGSYHWMYDQAILVRDELGNPKEVIGSWLDISDRRLAEITITEWKNRYELVVASSGQVIYDNNLPADTILWSGNLKQVLGYDSDDFLGGNKAWIELIHPDDREKTVTTYEVVEKSADPFDVEYRFLHKNGEYRWIHDRGFFITDINRKAVRMLGVMEDITRARQLEEDLRKLSIAVEQSPASIVITKTTGEIEYVNLKFQQVTGYTSAEVVGKNPKILKSGETPDSEYKRLWEVITSGDEWHGEFHNKKKNGEMYWESATISPIKDPKGNVTHFLAVKEDITAKKIFEAQMYRSQRLESIGTLAGGVAHDLNNVFSPILMAIQLLQSNASEDKKREWLIMLQSSAERGANIVKQLLTFARGYEGEKILLQPKHLIREIEKIMKETFSRNIHVSCDISPQLWTVSGDITQLHQVLMNLCVNARDAMPSGGRLLIKASNVVLDERAVQLYFNGKPGPFVVVIVEDTGMGIPKKIIDKIYDPFFTTKEVGKGTGLGLSTVMSIVKSHGGFLTVYSEVGRGTSFKVYLPASDVVSPEQVHVDVSKYPIGKGEGILLVDDEAPIREVAKGILDTYGYRTFIAEDGTEAIVQYTLHHDAIQLVITDMMMPNMDGTALIRTLQKIDPTVRIIATSGLTDVEAISEVNSTNVRAFLHKPYQADKLLTVVHEIINA